MSLRGATALFGHFGIEAAACGRPGFPVCRSPAPRWPRSAWRSHPSGPWPPPWSTSKLW